MTIYTVDDLKNMNSSQKQNVLAAEKTFITFGEGPAMTAFCLCDIILELVKKPKQAKKEKVLGAVKPKKTSKKK